jgi:hypothetical protein
MPFKRRIDKARDPVITPQMVTIFERMKRCNGKKWWALHGELFDQYQRALSPRTRPWQWPLVQSPREAEQEGERPAALELWRALNDASREARATRNGGLAA